MCKPRRLALVATLAALLLAAAPAIAAPTPDVGPALQLRAFLADAWEAFTAPVVALFDKSTHLIDPNGEPSAASDANDPTPTTESTHVIDPDG